MKKLLCLVLAMGLMLSVYGCGQQKTIDAKQPFQWKLSAEQILFYHSPEQCMNYLKENIQDPFQSGQAGEDGSLTLTMTESQRQAILDFFHGMIDKSLVEYNDGTKIRAEVTEDCRELHIYMLMNDFPDMSMEDYPVFAYLYSAGYMRMFSDFCPEDYGEFKIYVHNADTEKVIDSLDFSAIYEELNVDEWKWADSYVLTAAEAEAYKSEKECRERVLFETLTPDIHDSYVQLVDKLPKMITRDYSYFYLDEDYRFHLGLTQEQEEKAKKNLEEFIHAVEKDLEARDGNLEIAPDRRSYQISFQKGENYGLNYYTVMTACCLLAQSLENPEEVPFVRADIYQGDIFLGTADTENGIPHGILPDALVSESDH